MNYVNYSSATKEPLPALKFHIINVPVLSERELDCAHNGFQDVYLLDNRLNARECYWILNQADST